MRFVAVLALTLTALAGAAASAGEHAPDTMTFWRGFFTRPATVPEPPDNPSSSEKIVLGERLFRDTRLSGAGSRSCASCHDPQRGFTDGRNRALSLDGRPLRRNTPSLYDLAWATSFGWDGQAPSIEAQARRPIEDPDEMGGPWPIVTAHLKNDPGLLAAFGAAFPGEALDAATITQALGAYVRSLVSPATRFDRWIAGDESALSAREVAGFRLFVGKAGCVGCHAGWRFTDGDFYVTGLAGDDPGRAAVAGGTPGLQAFKTPSLRNLGATAPYMHDGSLPTLSAVLDHYTNGIAERPGISLKLIRPLVLVADERADLLAFLATLASE